MTLIRLLLRWKVVKLGNPTFLSYVGTSLTLRQCEKWGNAKKKNHTIATAVPHSWTWTVNRFNSPSSRWHYRRHTLRYKTVTPSVTAQPELEPSTSPGGNIGDRNRRAVKGEPELEHEDCCIWLTPITLTSLDRNRKSKQEMKYTYLADYDCPYGNGIYNTDIEQYGHIFKFRTVCEHNKSRI